MPAEQQAGFNWAPMELCPNCECSMRLFPRFDQARQHRCPGCGRVRHDRPRAVMCWVWRCDNCKAEVTTKPVTLGQVIDRGAIDAATD